MASLLCKLRSVASRSRTLIPQTLASKAPLHSLPSSDRTVRSVARISIAFGCTESLMPLHSAIASSRLKSNIGVNSAYWSCLSQGFALPL